MQLRDYFGRHTLPGLAAGDRICNLATDIAFGAIALGRATAAAEFAVRAIVDAECVATERLAVAVNLAWGADRHVLGRADEGRVGGADQLAGEPDRATGVLDTGRRALLAGGRLNAHRAVAVVVLGARAAGFARAKRAAAGVDLAIGARGHVVCDANRVRGRVVVARAVGSVHGNDVVLAVGRGGSRAWRGRVIAARGLECERA